MNRFLEIFCDKDGKMSSKRVGGLIGWITVGALILVTAIQTLSIPPITAEYMYTSAALIGLGSVLKAVSNKNESEG